MTGRSCISDLPERQINLVEVITDKIRLFDVVALTEDLPKYELRRGEIGAIVEVHPTGGYEVEFFSQDGYTYALITVKKEQLIALR